MKIRRLLPGGQYAGIAVLVAISLLAALGLTLVPDGWLWLLGLIPLLLGVRKLVIAIRAARRGETIPAAVATGLAGVIGLTIANGGDNIAAYTPVFRAIRGVVKEAARSRQRRYITWSTRRRRSGSVLQTRVATRYV